MSGAELQDLFKTLLPDDSGGPKYPRGHWIVWSTTRQPVVGRLVLVRDAHGRLHAREYHQGAAPGKWHASAPNPAYASFDGDDLTIVAVYKGQLDPDD